MSKAQDKVVDTILSLLDGDTLPWHCPYILKPQSNAVSKKPYNGVNTFITALAAQRRGYKSPYWLTYNQVVEKGGQLVDAKGHGIPIIFYRKLEPDSKVSTDTSGSPHRSVFTVSTVFNLDLVEGIPLETFTFPASDAQPHADSQALAAAYIEREQLLFVEAHAVPSYAPSIDRVRMLPLASIENTHEYYSTLFHELAHSTGHGKRLNRFTSDNFSAIDHTQYSKEEMIAEISSAILCHRTGIDSTASTRNSAAYIQGFMRSIRDHKNEFLTAVTAAYKAVKFITGEDLNAA